MGVLIWISFIAGYGVVGNNSVATTQWYDCTDHLMCKLIKKENISTRDNGNMKHLGFQENIVIILSMLIFLGCITAVVRIKQVSERKSAEEWEETLPDYEAVLQMDEEAAWLPDYDTAVQNHL